MIHLLEVEIISEAENDVTIDAKLVVMLVLPIRFAN
jgi:hypothetical protein